MPTTVSILGSKHAEVPQCQENSHLGLFSGTSECEWDGWNKLKVAAVIHSSEYDQFAICKKKAVSRIVLSHITDDLTECLAILVANSEEWVGCKGCAPFPRWLDISWCAVWTGACWQCDRKISGVWLESIDNFGALSNIK
ncbi:hypothetical protein CPSG_09997 [Coccidioides posadasii str. Silveira]|uniref:Uncharacterized protein n=1 Tax=Coccidioides posadasii (strain RMSCC 757 / Silveira) TaxID=443226 RepID=E9DJJ8_COCPS|nr:hypothetical protein CPSG_09997 [Coccidioides posadasii str. Silveira]